MSLLEQKITPDAENNIAESAGSGGLKRILLAAAISALLLSSIIGGYIYLTRDKPVASGQILSLRVHPRHMTTKGTDANGDKIAQQQFDQLLIFAHLRLHNESSTPLFLRDILLNLDEPAGIDSISAASHVQYDQVFAVYPELAPLRNQPLSPLADIPPGQSIEGDILWAVTRNQAQWDARKGLDVTVQLMYQPSLKLAAPTTIEIR